MINYNLLLFSFISLILLSCGGSSNDSSIADNSNTDNSFNPPSNLNGLIAFNRMRAGSHEVSGMFVLGLSNGKIEKKKLITNLHSGDRNPYAFSRNKILFAKHCNGGKSTHQIAYINTQGLVSEEKVSPCSSTIKFPGEVYGDYHDENRYAPIVVGKLSPDESKIAIEVMHYAGVNEDYNHIYVYDVRTGNELKHFYHFGNPEWHPDGRLLLSPVSTKVEETGIYITDPDLSKPRRIDQGKINMRIFHPDISPSGKQVVFAMGQDIWIMDINGNDFRPLIDEDTDLKYPTWSPDGGYIAYLSYGVNDAYPRLTFFNMRNTNSYILNTDDILPREGPLGGIVVPAGPLSWVK